MSINWQEGSWRKDDGRVDARLMIAGDWCPLWLYEDLVLASPAEIYGDLLAELQRVDLAVVNLECALGAVGAPIFKAGPNLRAPTKAMAALQAVPFHVATLGNNHVLDYGPVGLAETRRLLGAANIQTVGAGPDERAAWAPLVVKVGQARVGFINFGEGEDATAATVDRPGVAGWDIDRAMREVAAARRQVDVLLVVCHAGREHTPLPPPYVVSAYRRLAAAGADAVIAHHPHVPQGVEIRGGVPIVYSTGNFVFNAPKGSFYRKSGYLVEVELTGRHLAGLRLHPYLIEPQGLRLLRDGARQFFLGRLERVSKLLADEADVRAAWEAFIDFVQQGGEPHLTRILDWVLEGWQADPRHGAGRARNLFCCPSSSEFWRDATSRIVEGRLDTAPAWANELVQEWTSLSVAEALQQAK